MAQAAVAVAKTNPGNHFEDFAVGQRFRSMPVTMGPETRLEQGLYGSRLIIPASDTFARSVGYERAPLSRMAVFHNIFGLTVPDISRNARANLGYAEVELTGDVYEGDTLTAETEVIGLKQNSNGKTGNVYVHTRGFNQRGEEVVSFKRWVMVKKGDIEAPAPDTVIPDLAKAVDPSGIVVSSDLQIPAGTFDAVLTASPFASDDYVVGEKIAHSATVQMTEDHTVATRLAGLNNAAVHFGTLTPAPDGEKRRLIYGGHVMRHAFAQTNDGLGNVLDVVAINGGAHVAPTFEGDSIRSYSEILAKAPLPGRDDIELVRVRTVAVKNLSDDVFANFPYKRKDGKYEEGVVLDMDYWVAMPTQQSLAKPDMPIPANHRLDRDATDEVFQFEPRPERAVHFFPPHVEKMRAKAAEMVGKVDVLLGNFEDGVSPDDKVAARKGFIEFARSTDMGNTGLWTRINALDTDWGIDDVREIVSAVGDKIDTIMLPMVRTPEEVKQLDKLLTVLEAEHGITKPIRIHCILETGTGIVNVNEIAAAMAATGRGHGMSFGPADYAADMGLKTQDVGGGVNGYGVLGPQVDGASAIARDFGRQDIWHYHISAMVAACRANNLKPMYGPFGNFGDMDACRQQFLNAYLMGCEGAWTLHPKQIEAALEVFAPSQKEVAIALDRIKTFSENGGQSYYERSTGKFVDEAVIKQAQVFVRLAEQLAARDPRYLAIYGLAEDAEDGGPARKR